MAGSNEVYALDAGYRTAHHGAALMPPENSQMRAVTIEGRQKSEMPAVVFAKDALTMIVFPVRHDPVVSRSKRGRKTQVASKGLKAGFFGPMKSPDSAESSVEQLPNGQLRARKHR